jgi:TrmH family RNA methyltransferase
VPKSPTDLGAAHADSPRGRSPETDFDHVKSPANDTIKLLRSLDRKKARAESGLFLAEGARLAEAALTNGWTPAFAVAGQASLGRPRTADLLQRLQAAGARVMTTTDRILETVSRKDNPQTVITAFRQRLSPIDSLSGPGARRWLALYEVRDPGNLGSILRTADAAGVDGVILVGNCCDPFSTESVRATMGSLFSVRLAEATADSFLAWRTQQQAELVAASMRAQDQHHEPSYACRTVILMGNEQSGLPSAIEAACDRLVRIPMRGDADSLNLAAATAIMVYEVWRSQNYAGACP